MTVALWTGLRTSELIALDWADIDWRRGELRIRRAITREATEAEDTKTRAGRREVKLLAPALAAIKAQRSHTETQAAHVFAGPRTGQRWRDGQQ